MAEIERKRKRPLSDEPKTQSKKPASPILPSSAPLPESTTRSLLEQPVPDLIKLPFAHKINPLLPQSSFDIFALFCPESMVELWAEYVNIRRDEPDFQPTFKEEIYLFLGVLLYMCSYALDTMDMYWDTSDIAQAHPFTRFIARDRFSAIYRRFCTWDPTHDMPSVFEKVEPWSTHIQDTSVALWRPSSHVSVDESMVRSKGRKGGKKDIVHPPGKPAFVGYKVWVLADSGYFLRWTFHSGDKGAIDCKSSQYSELAPTQRIIADLLQQLPPPLSPLHGYHCFMADKLLTTQLVGALRDNNVAVTLTSTTRADRIGSKQLACLETSEKTKDLSRGSLSTKNYTDQIGSKDNALLTPDFEGWEPPVERQRDQPSESSTSKAAGQPFQAQGQATKHLTPHVTDAYNNNVNGVAMGDQLRVGYAPKWRMRGGKQQSIPYIFLLGVAVTNSYLLQRNSSQSTEETIGAFRKGLFTEIIDRFGVKVALRVSGQATSESMMGRHTSTKREARAYCAFCSSKKRNWLTSESHLSEAPAQKCHIITGCDACKVNLCNNSKRKCFQLWHDALEKSGGL